MCMLLFFSNTDGNSDSSMHTVRGEKDFPNNSASHGTNPLSEINTVVDIISMDHSSDEENELIIVDKVTSIEECREMNVVVKTIPQTPSINNVRRRTVASPRVLKILKDK